MVEGGGSASELDRRRLLQAAAIASAGATIQGASGAWRPVEAAPPADAPALRAAFADPPPSAGPGAYWYWLGGAVTREGITADLEAMAANGISFVLMFSIGASGEHPQVTPPADALTPLWWDLLHHAVAEAGRLGLTMGLNICDGWATASGPWITPATSMQKLVWSETVLEGGARPASPLPRPQAMRDFYYDVRTVAFPFPDAWDRTSAGEGARITSDMAQTGLARLSDPANAQPVIDTDRAGYVQFDFPRPFTLRSVTVRTPPTPGYSNGVQRAANSLTVQASDDGVHFRTIGALEYPRHGWQTPLTTLTHALPETTAKAFRFLYVPAEPGPYYEDYDFGQYVRLRLNGLVLSSTPRIHQLPGKSGEVWAISRRTTAAEVPDAACVKLRDMVDLTGRLGPDGRLDWTPPPGRWKVVRIGATTTGAQNSAAGGAQGLECDKFSAEIARLQFDNWFGKALERVGPELAGKVLHGVHVDSWEALSQNWSRAYPAGFQRLRGYDLLPYLAVMTGTPVESADASERILADVRRTISDLTETEFFATVSRLAHERGCIFTAEVPNPTFPADGFQHARYVDLPMGEFWLNTPRNDKPTDIKDAVNGARIYGRRIAGAESFTEGGSGSITWTETPWTLKALGDHNWCEGINRLILHVYAAQPWLDRAPGETLSGIGTFFGRTQTWWKPGKAWFDYLRRGQALLQQGRAAVDLAYFTGEDIPARSLLPHQLKPALPRGYAYDCINRDALLTLARVEDGALVLPGGARYRALVLPDSPLMTPEVAHAVEGFVRAGLTVVGPPPRRSPSFSDHGPADRQVAAVAQALWAGLDGTRITERRVGRGRVAWGAPLERLLGDLGPDVAISGAEAVSWTHRTGPGWDVYFLSNPGDAAIAFEAELRIAGRVPELWRPDTGEIAEAPAWRTAGGRTAGGRTATGRTVLPIRLDPRGSVFVVFARPATQADPVVAGATDGLELARPHGDLEAWAERPGAWALRTRDGRTLRARSDAAPRVIAVGGPWRVRFADRLPAPRQIVLARLETWGAQADPDIRFYSGTAGYEGGFVLPPELLDHRLRLDLGAVADLAEVRLNGQDLGVLWKPPFALDISAHARAGANRLEICVTNTWRNRLIGDHGRPPAERTTYVVPWLRKGQDWLPGGPGVELSPAGLLGPVTITALPRVRLA